MGQSISTKKLDKIFAELKEISHTDFQLYTVKGKRMAATGEAEDFSGLAVQFAESPAETQVVKGWIFLRLDLDGKTEYVLMCSRESESDYSYVIGRMALCQIRHLFLAMRDSESKRNVLRQILNGELYGEKLAEMCHQVQLKPGKYMLYVIQYKSDPDAILLEMLKHFFVGTSMDYVVEIDGTRTVLVKNISGIPNENYKKYAQTIVDNLQTEAMMGVWVGYGETTDSFEKMSAMYQNACTALKIGMVFYSSERVFCYSRLGIARLIYKLPADLCELFLKEVLGENMDVDFDEETMMTISRLFDHNLNISETARQLYIHRNTLVYRLERIEKRLGLDIRTFEDAMIFKIAMMVRVHLNELHKGFLEHP